MSILQVNSHSIDQKSGEIWTVRADLQPISFKPDRLLDRTNCRGDAWFAKVRSMTNKTESRGQKTVLIVEDQALMRQTLRDFLQGAFPSCNFREAVDGVSALQVAVGIAPTANMEAS